MGIGDDTRIFGGEFVENNKNNIEIMINGIKSELIDECKLKKGKNIIEIIIKNRIINMEQMFCICSIFDKYRRIKEFSCKRNK